VRWRVSWSTPSRLAGDIPVKRCGALPSTRRAGRGRLALEMLEGSAALSRFHLELFSPVSPMLAQTARTWRGGSAFCRVMWVEWKMDGARIQVTRSTRMSAYYTRSLNEVTGRHSEVVETVRALPARVLVLMVKNSIDAAERPHPFQVTMRRFGAS